MDYALRDGVSFCEVGGRLLFLDIDADRYFALGRSVESSLKRAITGKSLDEEDRSRLAGLVDRGILGTGSNVGLPLGPCMPPPSPERSLLDVPLPSPTAWSTLVAISAIAASIARVKCRPLRANLAAAVADRGLRNSTEPLAVGLVAAAFGRAGNVISTHDRCLAQSLAVAHSVNARGGCAQVVLGVTLGPFHAHCWVQSGATVVNDRIDRVAGYTPILVV